MQPEPVPMSAMSIPSPDIVCDLPWRSSRRREAIERYFDEVFGFRARDQYIGSDFKFESPEFLVAGQMLRRYACGAASIIDK